MTPTRLLAANRTLRTAAVPLALGGLALHLWIGSRLPLLAVALGLGCHLAAVLLGRALLRRRPGAAADGNPAGGNPPDVSPAGGNPAAVVAVGGDGRGVGPGAGRG
ncbi:hypothetical protein ACIQBJ_04270 [Kitasatospora sp. NPDC088391]|uniref:hypothetical protein n=1 Tax=Kitasatospora sp. NPDC088391 TaxID=3364074 RepID=UPI003823AC96